MTDRMATPFECIDPAVGDRLWQLQRTDLGPPVRELLQAHVQACHACRLVVRQDERAQELGRAGRLGGHAHIGANGRPGRARWGFALAFAASLIAILAVPPRPATGVGDVRGAEAIRFTSPVEGQVRVAPNQPAGKVFRVGHRGKAGRLGTFLQPLRVALRGQLRGEIQQAKAVNRHQPADPFRANAGVHHRHHAAHAVPHQPDRGLRAVVRQQRIQVGQVVRKIIAAGIPGAQAKAAPVRGQHMPVAAEGVHHKLEGGRSVHPAVQHPEFGRIVPAPVAHMVGVATDGQGFRARYKMRGIHGGDCNGCSASRHQGDAIP